MVRRSDTPAPPAKLHVTLTTIAKGQVLHRKYLYRHRHMLENAFAQIKQWRGIATRYAKNVTSFIAAINIRCFFMWLNIS